MFVITNADLQILVLLVSTITSTLVTSILMSGVVTMFM